MAVGAVPSVLDSHYFSAGVDRGCPRLSAVLRAALPVSFSSALTIKASTTATISGSFGIRFSVGTCRPASRSAISLADAAGDSLASNSGGYSIELNLNLNVGGGPLATAAGVAAWVDLRRSNRRTEDRCSSRHDRNRWIGSRADFAVTRNLLPRRTAPPHRWWRDKIH